MTDIEKILENIVSPKRMMRVLQKQRLPALRKLAEDKPIPKRIQKAFLLDSLVDYYCNRNQETIACELTEIMYQCFDRTDAPEYPIDFDCEISIQQTMIECMVYSIRNLPHNDTPINYCEYTCRMVDRYEHDVYMASEMLHHRYYAYLDIIHDSVERIKNYINKPITEMEQLVELIEDVVYTDTDTDSDNAEEVEKWEVDPALLVCPSKMWKSNVNCPICLETHPRKQTVLTNCAHSFCHPCFSDFLRNALSESRPQCPLCRNLIFEVGVPTREVYTDYCYIESEASRNS